MHLTHNDYSNSGFDRGHLCPSADRTTSKKENEGTFLMTNIYPQSPNLNQQTWRFLEEYCQKSLTDNNKECYIFAGGFEFCMNVFGMSFKIAFPSKHFVTRVTFIFLVLFVNYFAVCFQISTCY